jgi:glycosyltransferase involved in cell wall biosynthesis
VSTSRRPRWRVLRVIARMNVGGPALQVTGLTLELDKERFEQRLLTGECGPGETDYLQLHDIDLDEVRIPGLGRAVNPLDDARALRRLVQEIHSFRPDVVHTHTAKAGVLGRVAAHLSRVRPQASIVHSFHGHLLHGYFGPATTRAVVALERALARGTDRLVAVGSQVRDDLVAARIGRPDQYVVVAPGITLPLAPPRAAARAALDIDHDRPVIAFVGRLTRIKRPDRLVESVKEVRARGTDAILIVAGDGDLLPAVRDQARPLGDAVRFLGIRSDIEVVLAAADVVVLTSDNEGMPVSLIEAAIASRPAVTTRVGSAGEVVLDGKTGYVVERNADALAEAMNRLLTNHDLRRRMGDAAHVYATTRFSRARLVADTANLYTELLMSRR